MNPEQSLLQIITAIGAPADLGLAELWPADMSLPLVVQWYHAAMPDSGLTDDVLRNGLTEAARRVASQDPHAPSLTASHWSDLESIGLKRPPPPPNPFPGICIV